MADNLEPIELKFVMNSPELLAEFQKVMGTVKNYDASVATAKKGFSDFVAEQLRAINALDANAKLTEKQAAALQRHADTLEYLHGKMQETFDPTQLGVYEYQLQQTQKAIDAIVEAANKNVQLMSPEEIEAANQKLEQALNLMDKISDTHLSPDIASPEELEVLSNEINKTEDGFQQLATVIDFVKAKMSGMDAGSEEFQQLEADIAAANDLLGRTPQLYDATGNSINQMADALKTFQEQLAGETNPENIKILNQNIETLENGIQAVKNAGKSGFDEFGNKIVEQKEKTVTLQTELEQLVNQMAKLRQANQEGSAEYDVLKNKAVEVRTAINLTNQEINAAAAPTTTFDKLIQTTSGIVSGFTMAQGAAALFGAENENAEKTIQKVTGAMAILQSLQEIQMQLKTADTTATNKQTAAQALYTTVVGTSSGALKIFRIALASTGIGLIIILLASLVANWDKVTASVKKSFPALDGFGDKFDKLKSYVMGFLSAYLETFKVVWDTMTKLFNKDWGGALDEIKNAPQRIANAGAAAVKEQDGKNAKTKEDKKTDAEIEAIQNKIRIEEKAGRSTDALEKQRFALSKKRYSDDAKELKKVKQEEAEYNASQWKIANDKHKAAMEKRLQQEAAAAKKARQIAIQLAADQKAIRKKVDDEIYKLNNKEDEGSELGAIKTKWENLRKDAQEKGLGKDSELMMKINVNEAKETDIKKYEIETKEKMAQLNQQKELYAAYESFKTNIARTEFAKRHNINLEEFGTFSQYLDDEIQKIKQKGDLTAQEADRLKKYENFKKDNDTDTGNEDTKKLDQAVQDTITHQEKLEAIQKQYNDRKKIIEANTSGELRTQKLAILEQERQEAIDSANAEAYQKSEVYQRLSENLVGITKRELAQKIIALQAFLAQAKNLSPEQKTKIETNLNSLKSMQAESNIGVYQNALLERKKQLIASIQSDAPKSVEQAIDEQEELAKVNEELRKTVAMRAQMVADGANQLAGGFKDMASAIGDSNEGLSATLDTMGDVLGVVGSAAQAGASFASGDIVGGIKATMQTITGIFNIGKKSRESEKKAMEEIKKRQAEQLQAQLDYNATLRQRMIAEVKINDLYKSRVDNIREEMAARKKASEDNLKDQQRLFNKLLGMQTVVGQYTQKYGGFLGIGKKTRVVDINQGISSILGVGAGTQITDELFEKLEKLNSEQPLTGDAKTAYEQLVKLRDEYGSIADAQAELEKQLKDVVTGTTAQSLADSIKEGLASGKKTFADFADDIEGFLRNAILSGISAKAIEPKIQELQDALFGMMDDGVLSQDDVDKFRQMYMAIVQQSEDMMGMINEAGIDLTSGSSSSNSLAGAYKAASQESIDLLSGNTAGLRLAALEGNNIAKNGFAQMLERSSKMIELQIDIEANTRRTADNTEKLYDVNDNVVKVADGQQKYYKALQAAGIIH